MAQQRRARAGPASASARTSPAGRCRRGSSAGAPGGPIGEIAVGRSGLGDGLVAFQQGPIGNAAIVGVQVTAPPAPFAVTLPKTWIGRSQLHVAWTGAESANGPLSYQPVLDGRAFGPPQTGLSYTFPAGAISTGTHDVQLIARDIFGQELLTPDSQVKVDGTRPRVRVSRRGQSLLVSVSDSGSGLVPGSVHVSFGDGAHAAKKRKAGHRYAHAGTFTVYVTARDRAGNRVFFKRREHV